MADDRSFVFSDPDNERYRGRWEMARTSLDKVLELNKEEGSEINSICTEIDWLGTRLTAVTQLYQRSKEEGAGSEELEKEVRDLKDQLRTCENDLDQARIRLNSLLKQ